MKSLHEQQKKYVEVRRKKNEHFFRNPLHKRLGKSIERFNKKITLGLLGKLLRIKPIKGTIPISSLRSVLFLRADAIGDAIVTRPLWLALKKRNPNIIIGVAGSYRNLPLLTTDPYVDHTYNFAESDKTKLQEEIVKARSENYDLVIACTLHQTTRNAVLARKASPHGLTASILRGTPDNRRRIFSKMVFLDPELSISQMVLQLQYMFEQLFGEKLADEERMPSIFIPEEIAVKVNDELQKRYSETETSHLIIINTESATEFREWGNANCIELAKQLTSLYPSAYVALLSSPHRSERLLQTLEAEHLPKTISFFPTVSILEAAALTGASSLVVSPDTSIIHVANAVHKPVIGLYVLKNEWTPYNVPAYAVYTKKGQPVSSISVDTVLQAAQDLLDPNSTTFRERKQHILLQ